MRKNLELEKLLFEFATKILKSHSTRDSSSPFQFLSYTWLMRNVYFFIALWFFWTSQKKRGTLAYNFYSNFTTLLCTRKIIKWQYIAFGTVLFHFCMSLLTDQCWFTAASRYCPSCKIKLHKFIRDLYFCATIHESTWFFGW